MTHFQAGPEILTAGVTSGTRPAMLAGAIENARTPQILADKGARASKDSVMIVHDHGRAVDTSAPPVPAAGESTWLPVIPDAIPRELTDAVAWYPAIIRPKATKVGQWDKIPGNPTTGQPAKWADPSTRCTFSEAYMAYQSGRFQGIGYMMDEAAGLIGIDLDKCVSPDGSIAPWALEIVQQFDGAYWEKSISGTGLRGFCRGTLPVGGCRSKIEGCSVELYADQRFLVVTGQVVRP